MIREDDDLPANLPGNLRAAAIKADDWDIPGLLSDAADRIEWLDSANREAADDGRLSALSMYVSGPLKITSASTQAPATQYRATHPNGRCTYHDTAKQAIDAVCDSAGIARLSKVGVEGGCPFCGGWKDEAERIGMAATERLSEMNFELAERSRALDALVQCIRKWAVEGDGVPEFVRPHYRRAHEILGMDDPKS